MSIEREEGYYPIKTYESEEVMIGYWYNGTEDAEGNKSSGYFDCSNHWNFFDSHFVYSSEVEKVGEIIKPEV